MSKRKSLTRVDQLSNRIGEVLAEFCDIPEKDMYEELLAIAEGWKMRLEELAEDEEDT